MRNFQGDASKQGKQFADICLDALRYAGWEVVTAEYAMPDVGLAVDAQATNQHGIDFFFEFKGSLQGDRPGSKRTDTLKKAIANGYLFTLSGEYQCCAPMILLTSHIPDGGSGLAMLNVLPRSTFFDVLNPWNHGKRLQWIANADERQLEKDIDTYRLIDLIKRQWCIGGAA